MTDVYVVLPAFLGGILGGLAIVGVSTWRAGKKERRTKPVAPDSPKPVTFGPYAGDRVFDRALGLDRRYIPIVPPVKLAAGETLIFDMGEPAQFRVCDAGSARRAVYEADDTAYHKQ